MKPSNMNQVQRFFLISLIAILAGQFLSLNGAIKELRILGTTATQAVIAYTSTDSSPCTIVVSESRELSPPVHDVNPAVFAGADQDHRYGNIANGRNRVFVVGRRVAQTGLDGRKYSRALQADTSHYFLVTCGSHTATGSFRTMNIPLGNTYADTLPADPANPGRYAWPEFVTKSRSESVIDPLTGALLRRLTLPQDNPENQTNRSFNWSGAVLDLDGAWIGKDAVKVDDSSSAEFLGAGNGNRYLLLRTNFAYIGSTGTNATYASSGSSIDYFVFYLKGKCVDCDTAGADNNKIEVCLTANGRTCSSKTMDYELTGNDSTYAVFPASGSANWMYEWFDSTHPALARPDITTRHGTVNVNDRVVTWKSGDYFSEQWTEGSTICLGTSPCTEYTISSIDSGTQLTLASPAGVIDSISWQANNFGVLIRKKTPSPHKISIRHGKYDIGISATPEGPANGNPDFCATSKSATGYYYCSIPLGGTNVLYSIKPESGEAHLLGQILPGAQGGTGPDRWSTSTRCYNTTAQFDRNNPRVIYCDAKDNAGNNIILRGTYKGMDNADAVSGSVASIEWDNLTKSSESRDVKAMIQRFDPAFTPGLFSCSISAVQRGATGNSVILMVCTRGGVQDTYAWNVVFDPDITTGNSIIAASNTYSKLPVRWCTNHTSNTAGDVTWQTVGTNPFAASATRTPGAGPFKSSIQSGPVALTADFKAGQILPGFSSLVCPEGSDGCSIITVDGEPCDPDPGIGEDNSDNDLRRRTSPGHCFGSPTWAYLQDSAAGDTFTIDRERVRLIGTFGNLWAIQRGYGGSTMAYHAPGSTIFTDCSSRSNIHSNNFGGTSWWNYVDDPHGDAMYADNYFPNNHTIFRDNRYIYPGNYTGYPADCPKEIPYCYKIGTGPLPGAFLNIPKIFVTGEYRFAGVKGLTGEMHESYHQSSSPEREKQWFVDFHSLVLSGTTSGTATPIAGQLYKLNRALDRKKASTLMVCGTKPLLDISGPIRQIQTTPADSYKYCVANQSGECYPGSVPGDIYVNCPMLTVPGCASGDAVGNFNDVCAINNAGHMQAAAQLGMAETDPNGRLARVITYGLNRYRIAQGEQRYWNGRTLPDGSWLLLRSFFLGGTRTEMLMTKLPSYPHTDSVDRGNFMAITVSLTPPKDRRIVSAVVEFGYAENGSPEEFYCTSRQEACIKDDEAAAEYRFASEKAAGVNCSSGCRIQIPAIPQRVLYYRAIYRNAENEVIATGSTQAVAVH